MGTPPAAVGNPTQFLHIHVHQLPGPVTFVAHRGGLRGADELAGEPVQFPQVRDLVAAQDPPHRARGQPELGPDPVLTPPGAGAQRQHPAFHLGAGAGRGGVGSRGPIMEAGLALVLVAGDPGRHALAGHTHGCGDVGLGHPGLVPFHDQEPAVEGGAGITVRHGSLRVGCGP